MIYFISIFIFVVVSLILLREYSKRRGLAILIALIKHSRTKEAKKLAERYLSDFPKSKVAWCLLGGIELELNNIDNAKSAYEKSLELAPKYSNALCGLGVVFRYEKDFEKAETYYY